MDKWKKCAGGEHLIFVFTQIITGWHSETDACMLSEISNISVCTFWGQAYTVFNAEICAQFYPWGHWWVKAKKKEKLFKKVNVIS